MKAKRISISVFVPIIVLLAVAAGLTYAQGPEPPSPRASQGTLGTSFTYQGQLKLDGDPVNDECWFAFRLYDDLAAADPVVTPLTTTTPISVSDGLFTVNLDFGSGAFAGDARWLGIQVKCGSESSYTPLGRQELTAAPYALYASAAGDADLLGGLPAGAFWTTGGNAGTDPTTHFVGTTDAVTLTLAVNGTPALRLVPTSDTPNLIGGYSSNSVDDGAFGATISGGGDTGNANRVTCNYGTIGGGYNNQAGDDDGNPATSRFSTIGGGEGNTASGDRSTVSGGQYNTASGNRSMIPGGRDNVAAGNYSLAAGRRAHADHDGAFVWADATDADFASTVANQFAVRATGGVQLAVGTGGLRLEPDNTSPNIVGGHDANTVQAGVRGATIGGGGTSNNPNQVTDYFGTVGGGRNNQAGDGDGGLNDSLCATVAGGDANVAWGYWSFIGGGNANWAGQVAVIGGGNRNVVSATTGFIGAGWENVITGTHMWYNNIVGGDENLITGTVSWSSIVGGDRNEIDSANRAFIGGGLQNTITSSGGASVIGGGEANTASGDRSTIGGGDSNTASGGRSTIGGGYSNEASGDYAATIAGGYNITATGSSSAVGGGRDNIAGGLRATVPGGYQNVAGGNYSFAAGRRAQANNNGCFVWGDSSDADIACDNDNRWVARASGGVYFYTNSGLTSGMYLAAGGSAWNAVSDRARKENLEPVDTQALLDRLANIEISTWNYQSQDPSIRHIGPMAQEFNALLPDLGGEGDTYINSMDAAGVALAAIQGLYGISQEQTDRIEELEAENAELYARLDDLEARLEGLDGGAAQPRRGNLLPWAGALLAGVGLGLVFKRDALAILFKGEGR